MYPKSIPKKYSLALGGGAARGLAHIGVIKYLMKQNINITEVSGTSMGAIVGAIFALGKTPDDMIDFAKSIKYYNLIDIDLKQGVLKGKKVIKKLEEIFGNKNIEDFDIKLKIVATNIETGEKKVFEKGSVVDAIRASISLPGIFSPYNISGNSYVDGGISNNLPIEVLEGKNIIAVSSLKQVNAPLKKERKVLGFSLPIGFLNINFQILQRTILLMMKQNEDRSINTLGKNISLIYPVYGSLGFISFDKVDEMVDVGYKEAKKIIKL